MSAIWTQITVIKFRHCEHYSLCAINSFWMKRRLVMMNPSEEEMGMATEAESMEMEEATDADADDASVSE